jgi:sugar phosphate isomerase/epimerase
VEKWDPEAFAPVLERVPAGRTVDIGHLWLEGVEPLERLPRWIGRARVVHLHGIAARDHVSLAHVPPARLDPVVAYLDRHFEGVLTLEVFNQDDLLSSLDALAAAHARNDGSSQKNG